MLLRTVILAIISSTLATLTLQQGTDFSYIYEQRSQRVDYPVAFTYINMVKTWPPAQSLAQMGVPGYAEPHSYNYIALAFWTCSEGPTDASKVWDDPVSFWGEQLGSTKQQVQTFLKDKYNSGGVSIMLSAFGATEYPTTLGLDPNECAEKLGAYVKSNNFDGVDVDYEDNKAMTEGTGQQWVITFTRALRTILPFHLITHAPQAPYFSTANYKQGGYMTVHSDVGHLIDFYNIQYYNQGNNPFESFEEIFLESTPNSPETSVKELLDKDIPIEMLVVGKPGSPEDVYSTGYVEPSQMLLYVIQAQKQLGWVTGMMVWQYQSDLNGTIINELSRTLHALRLDSK